MAPKKASVIFCAFLGEYLRKKGLTTPLPARYERRVALVLDPLNEDERQDTLCEVAERLLSKDCLDPSKGFDQALDFAWKELRYASMDVRRKSVSDKERTKGILPLLWDVPGEEAPQALDFDTILSDPGVRKELKEVHPDALLFLTLLLEGHTQKEILGDPTKGIPSMLPHWSNTVAAWAPKPDRDKTRKILGVLRRYLELEDSVESPNPA